MQEMQENSGLSFYTTTEIAEMLKMNVQVIARKLQYGELTGYKIGKDWRVSQVDLVEWLERHSNKNKLSPGELVISRFMKNGKFETLPAQHKRSKYIFEYILRQFELNRIYSEKEINETISRYHEDYCRIRRAFVDEGMMNRKNGKYRRNVSYVFMK